MKKRITKIAVLGSGVMGSRIACHFANIGASVLLLDIVPKELNEKEKKSGKTLEDKEVRNRIVNDSLATVLKSKPASLYLPEFKDRIRTGNFNDDISKISECDWTIEAIIENPKIKRSLYASVEKHRKPGTFITTNTSGIPTSVLTEGRSEDFKKHFCGTHFFNPPRYLPLLEIIPGKDTLPEVISFFESYGFFSLGKETVLCKDTPAFIANRIGIFSLQTVLTCFQKYGLSISHVDALTGTLIGRPKSASFRTLDVVGLDTTISVANGLFHSLKHDEYVEHFKVSDFLLEMEKRGFLGEKQKKGSTKKKLQKKERLFSR